MPPLTLLAVPLWRKGLAVAALGGCLLLAWRSAAVRPAEVEVTWVLAHVEAHSAGAVLGRDRLVELSWSVADAPGSAQAASSGRFHFALGQAPEVVGPSSLRIPPGVGQVVVRCSFALVGGATLTTQRVLAAPSGPGRATVDVDTCAP